ncbi:pyocin activator PrtN family protein [Thalassotalea agarivorans]|uniref:Pyocin activator protein PrtN n=1 Tax=Thalassotalea agarivorans TaxID=349064 RepID=A0A1I0H3U6_THASX|nr:pyocin activator PrtN family protein [Thalassotalea agarivorans]SET78188.1 Pyocin activator protein PrtN [Thalassotalea agarivorans]
MANQNGTSTILYLLMAEFGSRMMIPLEELAQSVLGLSINVAKRRAKSCELPFPTVKLNDSQKAPYLVSINDLANYIEGRCNTARIEWNKLQDF